MRVGEVGHGLVVILSGEVAVTRRRGDGPSEPIVTHGPGGFMGELAQLSGRPVLVDAHALGEVDALMIAPDKLRALMIAEAMLGEEIMRALILPRGGRGRPAPLQLPWPQWPPAPAAGSGRRRRRPDASGEVPSRRRRTADRPLPGWPDAAQP
jgi:hypothetical protein